MKTKCIFVTPHSALSTKRFLILAQSMVQKGVELSFFATHDWQKKLISKEDIKFHDSYDELQLLKFYNYKRILNSIISRSLITLGIVFRVVFPVLLFILKRDKIGNENNPINKQTFPLLLKMYKEFFAKNFSDFMINTYKIKSFLTKNEITHLFYEDEMIFGTRLFCLAAGELNISRISLQHAEGWTEQYHNYPIYAEYAVAYSPFNYLCLSNKDVKDLKIIKAGKPEFDYIFKTQKFFLEKKNTKKEFKVLIPLKRNIFNYSQLNSLIIQSAVKVFNDSNKYKISIKTRVEPGDPPTVIPDNLKTLINIVDPTLPMWEIIHEYDLIISLNSSIIIDAAAARVPFVLISNEVSKSEIWPNWDACNYHIGATLNNLDEILENLKTSIPKVDEAARDRLLQKFSYGIDGQCCERIINGVFGD